MANIGNSFENSCILTAVGVIAILINSAVITHIGRRRIFLIIGMLLCGLTQLLSAIVYTISPGTVSTGRAIVGLSVVYIMGYNVRDHVLCNITTGISSLLSYTCLLTGLHREWLPPTPGSLEENCRHSDCVLTHSAWQPRSRSSRHGSLPSPPLTLSTHKVSTGDQSMDIFGWLHAGSARKYQYLKQNGLSFHNPTNIIQCLGFLLPSGSQGSYARRN